MIGTVPPMPWTIHDATSADDPSSSGAAGTNIDDCNEVLMLAISPIAREDQEVWRGNLRGRICGDAG